MRVALIHDYLVQFGGAERTLLALSELFPDAPIYTLLYNREKMAFWFGGKDIRTSFLNILPDTITRNHRFLLPLYPFAAQSLKITGYDVVISSSSAFAKGVSIESGIPHVCYCHSPTRFLWDYQEKYIQDNSVSFFMRILLTPIISALRLWDKRIADKVDVWIAPSQTVKDRIKKYYNADAQVLYPPINTFHNDLKHSNVYANNYFLVVSRLSAYKKIDLIIQTFNKIQLPLVIVGDGIERQKLQKMSRSNIIFRGFVDDGELPDLYRNARAVIIACEEDFGLIPAEAAYYGKPALAYKKGGIAEWLESGKTGEFFDEQSVESLAQGVYKILAGEYNPEYVMKKVEQFNKTLFQNNVLKVIKETIDSKVK